MPQPPSLRSARQLQPPTGSGSCQPALIAHHMTGSPSRPSSKAQWMVRWPMARRHCSAVAATRPRRFAVAAIFFDAFTVIPIGFSMSTLTPARSSWQPRTWCRPWGLQMSAPSTFEAAVEQVVDAAEGGHLPTRPGGEAVGESLGPLLRLVHGGDDAEAVLAPLQQLLVAAQVGAGHAAAAHDRQVHPLALALGHRLPFGEVPPI